MYLLYLVLRTPMPNLDNLDNLDANFRHQRLDRLS